MRSKYPTHTSATSGFSLLELMVVIAIIAILTAVAVMAFSGSLEKQRLTGAAETLLADLRWARAEAIKRNHKVRVTFTTGSNWSYSIDTVGAGTIQLKAVSGGDFAATNLSSASFDNNGAAVTYTTFDPARGINENTGTASLTSPNNTANIIVSALGRVHICGKLGGYEAC